MVSDELVPWLRPKVEADLKRWRDEHLSGAIACETLNT